MTRSEIGWRRYALPVGVGLVALLILLYSFLIAGQLLVGLWLLVFCYVLSLGYRFVRAHERIADALESRDTESGRNRDAGDR